MLSVIVGKCISLHIGIWKSFFATCFLQYWCYDLGKLTKNILQGWCGLCVTCYMQCKWANFCLIVNVRLSPKYVHGVIYAWLCHFCYRLKSEFCIRYTVLAIKLLLYWYIWVICKIVSCRNQTILYHNNMDDI